MAIDFSRIVTAEQRAGEAALIADRAIKAACRDRIAGVLDATTLSNIHGAALAGRLGKADTATFVRAQDWIVQMQAICRTARAAGTPPAAWPTLPRGVAALARKY